MSITNNLPSLIGGLLIVGRVVFALFQMVRPSSNPAPLGGGFAGLAVVCLGVLLLVIGALTGH
jgi:hypothetical protein